MKYQTFTRAFAGVLPVVALAMFASNSMAQVATLKVGDDAPAIKSLKFVKGEAVEKFEPGKVYVMEFWATWCGPCRAAIPHVTELQEKYKDSVVVIGQNVWEQDESLVPGFLREMGDKMNYRVAMDDKSTDPAGAMATTWMKAAGRNGIPCSMIVDQKGKIAWIGHPMSMDAVIEKVVAGTFDAGAEAAKSSKMESIQKRLNAAMQKKDIDGAIKVLDEAASISDDVAKQVSMAKFQILLKADRYDDAYATGDKVYDAIKDSSESLNELAWTIATGESIKKRDLKFAEKLAARSVELTKGENGAVLDTLARIYFDQENVDKAIETQQKAVAKAAPDEKAELAMTLEKYRQVKSGIR